MRSHLGKFSSTSTEDLEGNLENVTKFGYKATERCINFFFWKEFIENFLTFRWYSHSVNQLYALLSLSFYCRDSYAHVKTSQP